jgi:polyhydroxyalkanoate synthesis regulator phasin
MVDKPTAVAPEVKPPAPGTPPIRRGPGHRGQDVRDTVAEMAAKAQEISQEAGSKMAAAMKDVVNAAAGIAGFAVESARDLVQYMVRRGQMTQEEADKLIREAEAFQGKRKPGTTKPLAPPAPAARPAPPALAPRPVQAPPVAVRPAAPAAAKPVAKTAAKPARPAASAKPAAKAVARPAAKSAAKTPAKSASRKSVKPTAKGGKKR